MLTERRDYILRLIQQAAAAARRLREQLTGEAQPASDVARDAEQAIAELLGGGVQGQLLERVDAATAARLVGDPERVRAWIELLRVQADALAAGSAQDEARIRERAAALERASTLLDTR